MLLLSTKLQQLPIMSLQTGAKIAHITHSIVDPSTLDLVAYRVEDKKLGSEKWLLLARDIREVSDIGLIVDSVDELVREEDIVKLKKILELRFDLIEMSVVDDNGTKLGRIYDYSLDPLQFRIHQLYIKRPLIKSLQTSDLIVNRTQIVEVNDKNIVVNSASLEEKAKPAAVANSFVNPFRKSSPSHGQSTMKE